MADAQLELPCQLDWFGRLRSVNGNPFAALGPHDTRAGRITRAFLPSATEVELLRRSDGASRRTRAACSRPGFRPRARERRPGRIIMRWSIGPAPPERHLPS